MTGVPTNEADPSELEAMRARIAELEEENRRLRHNVEVFRRIAFGRGAEKALLTFVWGTRSGFRSLGLRLWSWGPAPSPRRARLRSKLAPLDSGSATAATETLRAAHAARTSRRFRRVARAGAIGRLARTGDRRLRQPTMPLARVARALAALSFLPAALGAQVAAATSTVPRTRARDAGVAAFATMAPAARRPLARPAAPVPAPSATTPAHRPCELVFRAEQEHASPFADVVLDVLFRAPDGAELRVPGFHAGGDT